MEFEWDPAKETANFRKHGVSFREACTVFGDALATIAPDPEHSGEEARSIIIGYSDKERPLLVAFAERGDKMRMISARRLTATERKTYEESQK